MLSGTDLQSTGTKPRNTLMNCCYLITLCIGGGFGGFVASIRTPNDHSIRAPFFNKQINLGFLGDVLIGVGASLAAFAFVSILPSTSMNDGTDAKADVVVLKLLLDLVSLPGTRASCSP